MSLLVLVIGAVSLSIVLYLTGRMLVEVLWRLFLAMLLAVFAALMLGSALFDSQENGTALGLICDLLLYPLLVKFVWFLRGPLLRGRSRSHTASGSEKEPIRASDAIETAAGIEGAGELIEAWQRAEALCGQSSLSEARGACARLLAKVQRSQTIDMRLVETASLVRDQIPALVNETIAVVEFSSRDNLREAAEELVRQLQRIGDMAATIASNNPVRAQEALSLRHKHISNRVAQFSHAGA